MNTLKIIPVQNVVAKPTSLVNCEQQEALFQKCLIFKIKNIQVLLAKDAPIQSFIKPKQVPSAMFLTFLQDKID